jgi:hypothetical protein
VTPAPATPGGPKIYMGGSTDKSAIRAGKGGYQYFPGHPDLFTLYKEEREKAGFPPPEELRQPAASFLYVSTIPIATGRWSRRMSPMPLTPMPNGPRSAAPARPVTSPPRRSKAEGDAQYQGADAGRMFRLSQGLGRGTAVTFHALLGGLDPEVSWRSLKLFEKDVLPRLRAEPGLLEVPGE